MKKDKFLQIIAGDYLVLWDMLTHCYL